MLSNDFSSHCFTPQVAYRCLASRVQTINSVGPPLPDHKQIVHNEFSTLGSSRKLIRRNPLYNVEGV